ncbi:MAG: glycosyltransferase family 2 protein [Bdellovibrionaceae bacterium]|nr:glycosyltransferase family 2 protein [Pseudobdellovibrionaceae bacterium]
MIRYFFETMLNSFIEFTIVYYMWANTVYMLLLVSAVYAIRKQSRLKPMVDLVQKAQGAYLPPISIIAPAYNEEATIVESIKSFLLLQYPDYNVIVVNDGSKDNTLQELEREFRLQKISRKIRSSLSETRVRQVYQSQLHPNLIVIDKENGGKADALNIGISASDYDLVCCVDSDSLLEEDALLKVAGPFLADPEKTIVCGGTVRVVNGSEVEHGRVTKIRLPDNFLGLLQVVEYTRSFLCGRTGWNVFNATTIISGAFGLFSKKAIMEVGGYRKGSVGEDMELIVRLHDHYRRNKKKYSIVFVPDPVCWTEAPRDLKILRNQRDRWHRGLMEVLSSYKKIFFNRRYGFLGLLAFPYLVMVELLEPVIGLFSLAVVAVGISLGYLEWSLVREYLLAGVLYSILLSVLSIIIEEIYFGRYRQPLQFLALLGAAFCETLFFKYIVSFWRIQGTIRYFRGGHNWGKMKRTGFRTPVKKAS